MEITMNPSDIANYLYYCTDEEYAETFSLYFHLHYHDIPSANIDVTDADDIRLSSKDMRIDIDGLTNHIKYTLDEIIYSDDIDASAWWKGERT